MPLVTHGCLTGECGGVPTYQTSAPVRLVEQPSSSLMPRHPRMAAFIQSLPNFDVVRFWMGVYGSKTPKPCMVFGTACGPKGAAGAQPRHLQSPCCKALFH